MTSLHKNGNERNMEDLYLLSHDPAQCVTQIKGNIYNGYKFHTEDHKKGLMTQNSGVVVVGDNGVDVANIDFNGS